MPGTVVNALNTLIHEIVITTLESRVFESLFSDWESETERLGLFPKNAQLGLL